jgi:hypothetical protein
MRFLKRKDLPQRRGDAENSICNMNVGSDTVGRDKALPFPTLIKPVHGELVEPSS